MSGGGAMDPDGNKIQKISVVLLPDTGGHLTMHRVPLVSGNTTILLNAYS